MIEGYKESVMVPRSWKLFLKKIGDVIPAKIRICNECKGKTICDRYIKQHYENREFERNLYLLKLQHPNQFAHMLPHFI